MTIPTISDYQFCPPSPEAQEISRPPIHICQTTTINPDQNSPRKKRTKMIKFQNMNAIVGGSGGESSGSHLRKTKYTKKLLDPTDPTITFPCSECGKTLSSEKAVYSHMRCHPERTWRGINPPPNLHHTPVAAHENDHTFPTTTEDLFIASCFLMLSKAPVTTSFECTSCKKVFGSHQALGGHRASHKNIKGCFAITRNEGGEEFEEGELEGRFENNISEHKCSICLEHP